MAKWTQLANTIELRIVVDSQLTDAATVTYLNSKYATLQASNNFVDADVLINQVTHQLTMTNKIRFGANVRDVAGFTSTTNYTFFTSSKYFADILNGAR
jgi:hypothetical protein